MDAILSFWRNFKENAEYSSAEIMCPASSDWNFLYKVLYPVHYQMQHETFLLVCFSE